MTQNLLEVRLSEQDLRDIEYMLQRMPKELPRVISRAINKTAKSARTMIARRLAGVVTIKYGYLLKAIDLKPATFKELVSQINVTSQRIPLIAFKAKQDRLGVKYQIQKDGEKSHARHAFITHVKSVRQRLIPGFEGHLGVFKRRSMLTGNKVSFTYKGTGEYFYKDFKRGDRLPIDELYGPSLGVLFETASGLAEECVKEAGKNLDKNIRTQLELLIDKNGLVGGGSIEVVGDA